MRSTLIKLLGLTLLGIAPAQDDPVKAEPVLQDAEKPERRRARIETSMGSITVSLFVDEAPKTVVNFLELAEGKKQFTDPKTGEQVEREYFDGLTFHRVIDNFMIQGGCPLGTGTGSPGYTFEDEINAKALGLHEMKAMEGEQPHRNLLIRSQEDFQRMVMIPVFRKLDIKSQEELDKRKGEVEALLKELTLMEVYENLGYRYDDSRPSHGMKRGTLAMANSGPNTNGSQFFINLVDNDYLAGKHTVFGEVVDGMDIVDKIGKVATNRMNAKPVKEVKIVSIREIEE